MPVISKKSGIRVNRILGWFFTVITIIMLTLGYTMTRLDVDKGIYQPLHIYLGYVYGLVLLTHFILSLHTIGYPWKRLWRSPSMLYGEWTATSVLQRVSSWILLLASTLMVTTGLGWNELIFYRLVPFTLHIQIDQIITVSLVIHVITGLKSAAARNKISIPGGGKGLTILSILLILTVIFIDINLGSKGIVIDDEVVYPDRYTDQNNTLPKRTGKFRIGHRFSGNTRTFEFDPGKVKTLRPDIFREGYVSVFDVLVHVAERGDLDLEYHFEESMNTHVIDSLEGTMDWWYEIYYNAGWPESNYYKMDHYPWKDGAYLTFFETSPGRVRETHEFFQDEVERLERNNGEVIIPNVYINGITDNWQFEDVHVTAHNLRSDMFRNGTITAIDVILSLGDQGDLNYTLQWYESIGEARIVKSFWVEEILGNKAQGRCGFVHEEGSTIGLDRGGNHIHLPADIKVLNSPDYAWWFYICR
jgi:hypothetical protein